MISDYLELFFFLYPLDIKAFYGSSHSINYGFVNKNILNLNQIITNKFQIPLNKNPIEGFDPKDFKILNVLSNSTKFSTIQKGDFSNLTLSQKQLLFTKLKSGIN